MTKAVHVAITRTIKPGCERRFESLLRDFFRDVMHDPGTFGAQMLSPIPGSGGRQYGILRSFVSTEARDAFYRSPRFLEWKRVVDALTEGTAEQREVHGLEAFFRDPSALRHPPRWKMAALTLLGVYPTAYVYSQLLHPFTSALPVAAAMFFTNLLVVPTLTWLVMPAIIRTFRHWIHSR
jgi:antibiotic biosynthesis monooxygenase (ABM) superfamily enzyme